MKLRIRGFEWRTGDAITPGDFLQYLQEISAREHSGQILTVTQQGDWWAGLLLTDRDARAFCKKVRRGTTFTVLPEHLADNTTVVDFNFFLVNPTTGRGLYQHYQHSPTVNQFCLFSQERFAELRQRRLEAEVKTLGPSPKRKAVVAVEERFLKRLGYNLLEQPGSFEEKVRSMQRAEAIHFELATLEPVEAETTPLVGAALTVRTTIRFDPKHPARQIVKSIADLAKRERFKNATVDGIDAAGQEATYKLINDVAVFGEADHALHAETVRIDSPGLVQAVRDSPTVRMLVETAERSEVRVLLNTMSTDG